MAATPRTAIRFPEDLKDEIEWDAGPGNFSAWVIDACRQKLARPAQEPTQPPERAAAQ